MPSRAQLPDALIDVLSCRVVVSCSCRGLVCRGWVAQVGLVGWLVGWLAGWLESGVCLGDLKV